MATVKGGKHLLVGNSAEYFVMAELLRDSKIAGLLPRNDTDHDIIASDGKKEVKIRVKSKSSEFDGWQWQAKKHPEYCLANICHNDFTILVNITKAPSNPEFFIFKSQFIEDFLQKNHRTWESSLGRGGISHSKDNKKRVLGYSKYKEIVESARDKWGILWD